MIGKVRHLVPGHDVAHENWSMGHEKGRPHVTPWWFHVSCGFDQIGQGSVRKMSAMCQGV
jgi:hypothetical protein